jgi:hypothetical protein
MTTMQKIEAAAEQRKAAGKSDELCWAELLSEFPTVHSNIIAEGVTAVYGPGAPAAITNRIAAQVDAVAKKLGYA